MRRMNFHGRIVLALLAITVGASSLSAGWNEFWHNLHVGYDRNNAWPDPFNDLDARQVIMPFEIQKRNGWRLQNTMGATLFRDGDGALVASGHEKVYHIATQAPAAHRQIHVLRGRSEQETKARVEAVRQSLASLNLQQGMPEVFVIDREPFASSGTAAVQINRQWLEQMPAPKLPSTSAAGTAAATQP